MSSSLNNVGIYLINVIFYSYALLLAIRLLLAYARANYFNPITQFIIKFTQPIVAPIRRVIPNYHGIEFSTLLLMIVLELLRITLISLLTYGLMDPIILFLLALGSTVKLILSVLFYGIIIQAILSWVQSSSPDVNRILEQITAPIMRPMRRLIPPVSGFDISPIPALILLQVLMMLIPG